MNFDEKEKNALKKSAAWLKKIKKETMHSNARHAYHKKITDAKRAERESLHGLSEGQRDQRWIDKSKAIQQKISKTKVHSHKSPP